MERRAAEEIKVDHPGGRRRIEERGKERAREKRRIGGRGGMRHKGAMEKEKIGEGMRVVLNGWGGEGGGGASI